MNQKKLNILRRYGVTYPKIEFGNSIDALQDFLELRNICYKQIVEDGQDFIVIY